MKKNISIMNLEDRVFFHESVGYSIVHERAKSVDAGMALVQNLCLSYYYTSPNKLFDYIQAGLPVVASSYPDISEIFSTCNNGMAVDFRSVNKIAKGIHTIFLDIDRFNPFVGNTKNEKELLTRENEENKLWQSYANQ